jgi:hypothetical protein
MRHRRALRVFLFVVCLVAGLTVSASGLRGLPSGYVVENDRGSATVLFETDAFRQTLTARIQRDGQPDHVFVQYLAELRLDVTVGDELVLTVQGHTAAAGGFVAAGASYIDESTAPQEMWRTAAAEDVRGALAADIAVLRSLPNRDVMNLFVGPYVLATGDIRSVLDEPKSTVRPIATPRGNDEGRFKVEPNLPSLWSCAEYSACYYGCVAGSGEWIGCGGYCHGIYGC